MTPIEYLEMIKTRLMRFYDFETTPAGNLDFALTAELHASDEGYFLMPSIKMYSVQHHEYLFVVNLTSVKDYDVLTPYLDYLRRLMQDLKTTTEHMNSLFTLLVIAKHTPTAAFIQQVEKYKYHKDYCFTLKGWSDLAIFVADLEQEKLYYNKAGKKTSNYFAFKA